MLKHYSLRVKLIGLVTVIFLTPFIFNYFFKKEINIGVHYIENRMINFSLANGSCIMIESSDFMFPQDSFISVEIEERNIYPEDYDFFRFEYKGSNTIDVRVIFFPWLLLIILPGFLCWLFHRRDKKRVVGENVEDTET